MGVQFHDYDPLLYVPFSYQFSCFHLAFVACSLSVQHSLPLFCFNIYSSAFQTTCWGFIHYYFRKVSCSEYFGTDADKVVRETVFFELCKIHSRTFQTFTSCFNSGSTLSLSVSARIDSKVCSITQYFFSALQHPLSLASLQRERQKEKDTKHL